MNTTILDTLMDVSAEQGLITFFLSRGKAHRVSNLYIASCIDAIAAGLEERAAREFLSCVLSHFRAMSPAIDLYKQWAEFMDCTLRYLAERPTIASVQPAAVVIADVAQLYERVSNAKEVTRDEFVEASEAANSSGVLGVEMGGFHSLNSAILATLIAADATIRENESLELALKSVGRMIRTVATVASDIAWEGRTHNSQTPIDSLMDNAHEEAYIAMAKMFLEIMAKTHTSSG